MKYRVDVRYYYFDFFDLNEACDFALKAKNSYVPDGKNDNPKVCIYFLDEHKKRMMKMNNEEAVKKLKDLTEGTIDHFDLEDAMDMLYEVKWILNHVEDDEDD